MSFLDRFKIQPKHKSTDPEVRLAAVPSELGVRDEEDAAVLVALAREDADARVQARRRGARRRRRGAGGDRRRATPTRASATRSLGRLARHRGVVDVGRARRCGAGRADASRSRSRRRQDVAGRQRPRRGGRTGSPTSRR